MTATTPIPPDPSGSDASRSEESRTDRSRTDASHPLLPEPPQAPREPKDVSVHGDRRIDEWFWLRDRDDPRTLAYLRAENAYAEAWLAPRAPLKDRLYQEMFSRIQQDDDSVPYRKGDWWYRSRTATGEQYPRHVRRRAAGPERRYDPAGRDETLLDLNELATGRAFLRLGVAAVSPDAARLAYSADFTGGRDYTLHVKDLASGTVDAWSMPEVASATWGADSRSLYYVTMDEAKRAHRLWRHVVGGSGADTLLLEEEDELFDLSVSRTRDDRWLLVASSSMDVAEVRVADAAAKPETFALRTVFPRGADIDYHLDHRDGRFYVRINDTGRNYRLVRVDADQLDLAAAEELIPARERVMLDDVDVFARHLVVTERVEGLLQLRVVDLVEGGEHTVAFDEPAYSVHASGNAEFETTTLRFVYTSLTTPASTYDYDLITRERVLRKRQPVPGYEPALYASERLMATAPDGTAVPVSLVWRRDRRQAGPQPLLLYGYGSYGIPLDPSFAQTRVSLLDRGVVFAIAHVRGGGDLGRSWYEAAKMATKAVTFSDFIACAEALIERGLTTPSQLAIEGGSAGGLLMGAVVNARPELFRAVVAEVPFVDVVNTMLDETLPLTVGEFVEWGNPKLPEQYAWMRAYSPYDNLKPGPYPAMLVRTGLNDSQVAYWEPAKYVARLRTLKTNSNPLLFRINLEVGHGGASGRFDSLHEIAEDTAFLLVQLGLED
ncbi:MAG TPA: S9 family peptidase [Caldimonas sp.]|jgi:oligopeptidase B|nr:S9 family peptidase [Caldimonas sp.]HEX2540742.1 S9 family peptidase [Caldimonas sp.]